MGGSGQQQSIADLSVRTVKAGQWRVASMAVQGTAQFGVGIVLSRILLPADFGVAALALIVIGLATLAADLGLGPAIVQRPHLTRRHLRVAFTASTLVGLVIAAAIGCLAPTIGTVMRSGAIPAVLRVQALMFVAAGAGTVGRAVLQRALDFRRLFVVEVVSYLIGYALIAIVGALLGWGVWSLVLGSLAQGVLASLISIVAARAPVMPLVALAELRELLVFGVGVSAASGVSYVARTADNFVVGRMLGAAALGLYARAFNLMMLPLNYLCSALPNVLTPAFAEIQGDRERVGRGFLMSVQLTAITTAPIMAGMIVAAPHLIRGLYGERWAGAVLPLQVLCVVGLPRAMHPLAGAVNRACNRVYSELWLQAGFAIAIGIAAVVGTRYGIVAVALLVSVAIVLMYVAMARLALQSTRVTWHAFAMAQIPGILVGVFTATLVLPLRLLLERLAMPSASIVVVLALVGALSIPLGIYLLPPGLRPRDLVARLSPPLRRLPPRLRFPLAQLLRVPT